MSSDDKREVWIGDRLVPVGKNSIVDVMFRDAERPPIARRMAWSLGMPADLMWMVLPESRPMLTRMVAKEFERAMDIGGELFGITDAEAVEEFWAQLFEPAFRDFPASRDVVARYCEFTRLMWEFECPERDDMVRRVVDNYVLELIASTSALWIVQEVDPALFELISKQYDGYFDLSPDRGDRPAATS